MHVFLTGEKQVGKSTALQKTAVLLNRSCFGFVTLFDDRFSPQKALYMLPAESFAPGVAPFLSEPLPHEKIVAQFQNGKPNALTERFDGLGAALLRQARAHAEGLIVMDECSRFEKNALSFQAEILRCLDGAIPVLGVVRQNATGWVDQIRFHKNVLLLTVTPETRADIPRIAAQSLLRSEEHHAGLNA